MVHGDQAFIPKPVDECRDRLPGGSHHVGDILVGQPQGQADAMILWFTVLLREPEEQRREAPWDAAKR